MFQFLEIAHIEPQARRKVYLAVVVFSVFVLLLAIRLVRVIPGDESAAFKVTIAFAVFSVLLLVLSRIPEVILECLKKDFAYKRQMLAFQQLCAIIPFGIVVYVLVLRLRGKL
ncbi:MAG: hypothetical protein JXB13_07470 [Phycisphaerae bacterium]|nr:hypothetical protein [Phycisphaerae bacterium]